MSTRTLPAIFARLVDDAAVFPPGNAPLSDAVAAHGEHRRAWYADLVGPLLVPASALPFLPGTGSLTIGVIGDTGIDGLTVIDKVDDRLTVHQVEVAIAKRGEDPQPGLRAFLTLLRARPTRQGYAETPLTWGLLAALDTLAGARATGTAVAPKFRTGGLAAELFPTPVELAAVMCACRDRALPFKLTAGLHHAIRHPDPETGFTHHGFLNVLAADLAAAGGAEPVDVAELLASTDPVPLIETARRGLNRERPLWIGFGTCSVMEPIEDLVRLGLLNGAPS